MEPFDAAHAGVFASVAPIEREIHELTNQARQTHGLAPYSYDPDLAYVGRVHSRDMAKRNFFSHTNPDDENPTERTNKYGLDSQFFSVTENLAKTGLGDDRDAKSLAQTLIGMWKESDPHWDTILDNGLDQHGAGVYVSEDKVVYATVMYGRVHRESRG